MQIDRAEIETRKQQDFMELYKPLNTRLSRFCESLSRNNEDARDLMSDTVVVAFENFEKLRSRDAFLAFLFGTASRIYRSRHRRKKFFGVFDEKKALEIEGSHSDGEMSAELSLLYKAMNRLPDEQRIAFALFEISDFSIKEICEMQHASETAVRTRISRGRQKLILMMKENKTAPSFIQEARLALTNLILFF